MLIILQIHAKDHMGVHAAEHLQDSELAYQRLPAPVTELKKS